MCSCRKRVQETECVSTFKFSIWKIRGELRGLVGDTQTNKRQHTHTHKEETHHADVESIEQVKGQGGNEIDKEPGGDVVNADGAGVVHDLTRRAHKSSSKVQQNVCRGRQQQQKLTAGSGRTEQVSLVGYMITAQLWKQVEWWELEKKHLIFNLNICSLDKKLTSIPWIIRFIHIYEQFLSVLLFKYLTLCSETDFLTTELQNSFLFISVSQTNVLARVYLFIYF